MSDQPLAEFAGQIAARTACTRCGEPLTVGQPVRSSEKRVGIRCACSGCSATWFVTVGMELVPSSGRAAA